MLFYQIISRKFRKRKQCLPEGVCGFRNVDSWILPSLWMLICARLVTKNTGGAFKSSGPEVNCLRHRQHSKITAQACSSLIGAVKLSMIMARFRHEFESRPTARTCRLPGPSDRRMTSLRSWQNCHHYSTLSWWKGLGKDKDNFLSVTNPLFRN